MEYDFVWHKSTVSIFTGVRFSLLLGRRTTTDKHRETRRIDIQKMYSHSLEVKSDATRGSTTMFRQISLTTIFLTLIVEEDSENGIERIRTEVVLISFFFLLQVLGR